ncbi:hypothetical protein [Sphingomonas morindae]|uniref:Uncharacterized protein n=1 Tax=Sphingomonas morindae TaxID=1541170 RepID=A0ABY4X3F5_9SPHN|nr:hypothetical protein [Sphingomonas morindae]USI71410.1 hypothetical protein LHA26_08635 [Sphingomonas morindae]
MTATPIDMSPEEKQALDGISVAPPEPADADAEAGAPATPEVREALDAESVTPEAQDPADPDAKLDIGIDESFPGSDVPSSTRPGHSDPAPSSGYDEEAERARTQ